MGFSKDWCYHHIDLAQLVWTYKSLISVGFSICSPNSKLFKHVGSKQKMTCHFRKDIPEIILKKQLTSGFSPPVIPSRKSTVVCPHRGEHGKNSQLHILQSLRSRKWGQWMRHKTSVDILWVDFFQSNRIKHLGKLLPIPSMYGIFTYMNTIFYH